MVFSHSEPLSVLACLQEWITFGKNFRCPLSRTRPNADILGLLTGDLSSYYFALRQGLECEGEKSGQVYCVHFCAYLFFDDLFWFAVVF
jgi:hypothetical protein